MHNALNKFWTLNCSRLHAGIQLTHSFMMFLNELDGGFNNHVVEKRFHNSARGILRINVEMCIGVGEGFEPGVNEIPTNQADLTD